MQVAGFSLGTYPTPVTRIDPLSGERAELWIKNDGIVHSEYGGNKVRKLERILGRAAQSGARRLVTMGAAGSHQVLATALFGKKLGLPTAAVLCPQPWTEHAESTLRASLALGIEPHLARSMASIATVLPRVVRRGDHVLAPGGSSIEGTLGFLHAMSELVDQIREGALPEPDVIIAPLGSGGTVAGLLAGALREGLATRVVGVDVAISAPVGRALALGLALAATRRDSGSAGVVRLGRQLEVSGDYLGPGYGHPTAAGSRAEEVARKLGLELDPTYTAKTFAAVLDRIDRASRRDRPERILYWHTLSAAPLTPLLAGAPALSERFSALLTGSRPT